jgi:hypothetical protein
VDASLKKDLEQQMRYYKSLGDNMPDEQLANNAYMLLQNKGGNLSPIQAEWFAQDIVSSYQLLLQLDQWEKQYSKGAPAPPGATPLK